jgi:hypothetical protein
MTPFHPQQSDRSRRVHQKVNASTVQIHVTNCTTKLHSHVHEARKIQCNNVQRTVQAHIANLSFFTSQALPLARASILRLANSSPKTARSPARRSRDVRETSGKKSGEISRVVSAQLPGNSPAAATAMPPDGRADDLQDNLPCAGHERAMSAPETCETTRHMSAHRPAQHLASGSLESRRQFLTMTLKNYEHTNHANARS